MNLTIKVGLFILFVIIYLGWLFLSGKRFWKTFKESFAGFRIWNNEINILSRIAAFLLFIFLLTGYFSLPLTLLLLASAQIGVLFTLLLVGFMGSDLPAYHAHTAWQGFDLGINHPRMFNFAITLGTFVALSYPLIAGYIYFTNPLPSPQLTLLIFRYTLLGVIFAGLPIILLVTIDALVSENIDEETRGVQVIAQLSMFTLNVLFILLAFWAFGITGTGIRYDLGDISITISPQLVTFLTTFLGLTILLPYLMGTNRAKKRRISLVRKRQTWLSSVLEILEFSVGSLDVEKLADLIEATDQERQKFTAKYNKIFWTASQIELDTNGQQAIEQEIIFAYKASRNLDLRFNYMDWLNNFRDKVSAMMDYLSTHTMDDRVEKTVEGWTKAFRSQKEELVDEIKSIKEEKPGLLIAVSLVLTPVLGIILNNLAESIWSAFASSLTK